MRTGPGNSSVLRLSCPERNISTIEAMLGERFGIGHVTLQVDHPPSQELLHVETGEHTDSR